MADEFSPEQRAAMEAAMRASQLIPPQKNLLTPELAKYASPVTMEGQPALNEWRAITDADGSAANPKLDNETLYVNKGIFPPKEYGNDATEGVEEDKREPTANVSPGAATPGQSEQATGQTLLRLLLKSLIK